MFLVCAIAHEDHSTNYRSKELEVGRPTSNVKENELQQKQPRIGKTRMALRGFRDFVDRHLIAAATAGLIVGLIAAIAGKAHVYRVTSGYSQRSFILTFESEPSEDALLDAVIYHEPLIQQKSDTTQAWRRAQAEGQQLRIKLDSSRSILVSPYSPDHDPDEIFPEGGRVTGIWLTQPSTRTHFPAALVRVVYFAAGFVVAAFASLLLYWLWYFLLASLRELSLAVRRPVRAIRDFVDRHLTTKTVLAVTALLVVASWIYPPWIIGSGRNVSHRWFSFSTRRAK